MQSSRSARASPSRLSLSASPNPSCGKPLPFADPDRLVSLERTEPDRPESSAAADREDYRAWRAETTVFEDAAAFQWSERRVLRGRGLPESVSVRPVTANFFEVLGRRPAVGQSFGSWRDAVLLSDAVWRRLFNADPQIVGTVVTLDDRPHVIAGVAADERLEFVGDSDAFTVLDVRPVATREHDTAP